MAVTILLATLPGLGVLVEADIPTICLATITLIVFRLSSLGLAGGACWSGMETYSGEDCAESCNEEGGELHV
jgi:hypothetical protein